VPRWKILSQAWSVGELSRLAGEALSALAVIRMARAGRVRATPERLFRSIKEVDRILTLLAEEVRSIERLSDQYSLPLDGLASPLLKAVLDAYGVANAKDALEKLGRLEKTLNKVIQGEFENYDVEELERFLEAVLDATTKEVERLTRFSEVLWEK